MKSCKSWNICNSWNIWNFRNAWNSRKARAGRIGVGGVALGLAAVLTTTGCGLTSDGSPDTGAATGAAPGSAAATPMPSPPQPAATAPTAPATSASAPPSRTGASTLVPGLQAAAERAVGGNAAASLIALDMRNGEIVSTVHRQAGMSGAVAPGSTFKIVTSALLLHRGIVTASTKLPCPKYTTVNGQSIHNVGLMEMPGATFRDDFAHSCNTAFINLRDRIKDDELSAFSTRYFGLNSDAWKVAPGQGSVDGVVPPAHDPNEKAAQMMGQGGLVMNPLTMASVVAAAITGKFRQPVLERGMPVYTRSEALPTNVTRTIRDMMVACATTGSAASVFKGMPGVGAKTGTAEVGDGTNGWMVAFRGNIAVAVYVEGGDSGSGAAGPIVREYLSAVAP
ncbi:penicillin-binding transpeptidase domain-containing protein [Yinghuangia sp. YIM S09857]|uniref:penicillin-binding transpeptidase domain-containing protein n=1 Tax=Yinghuangia sp. YIM S09857 TaxID=3436929 RepID=UPI003F53273B